MLCYATLVHDVISLGTEAGSGFASVERAPGTHPQELSALFQILVTLLFVAREDAGLLSRHPQGARLGLL